MNDTTEIQKQSIYLNGDKQIQVKLDGRALSVIAGTEAERLFPLSRVAQITSDVRVEWGTEALLACARSGIAITFRERDGGIAARMIGVGKEQQGLLQLIYNLLQRPDWELHYQQCITNLRMQAQLRLCQFLKVQDCQGINHPRANLEQTIRNIMVELSDEVAVTKLNQYWYHCCQSAVMERLQQQEGLHANSSYRLREGPALIDDLASIVEWETRSPRIGWLQQRRKHARRRGLVLAGITEQAVVTEFAKTRLMVDKRIAVTINKLQRWLVEFDA